MNNLIALLLLAGRLLVGSLLIVAGILKIQAGSHRFLRQVLAYDLVKGQFARLFARGLPWLEIGCSLFLLIGLLLPVTAVFGFALLGLFTIAIVATVVREKKVDCGCFGGRKSRLRWRLAYRNLALMGLLALLPAPGSSQWTVDAWLFNHGSTFSTLQSWLIAAWAGWPSRPPSGYQRC